MYTTDLSFSKTDRTIFEQNASFCIAAYAKSQKSSAVKTGKVKLRGKKERRKTTFVYTTNLQFV